MQLRSHSSDKLHQLGAAHFFCRPENRRDILSAIYLGTAVDSHETLDHRGWRERFQRQGAQRRKQIFVVSDVFILAQTRQWDATARRLLTRNLVAEISHADDVRVFRRHAALLDPSAQVILTQFLFLAGMIL